MKDMIKRMISRKKPQKKVKAVILDLDDTLWDTTGRLVKKGQVAALKEMARLGLPIKQSEAASVRDMLVRRYGQHINTTKKAIEHFGLDREDAKKAERIRMAGHRKYYSVDIIGNIRPFRDTVPTLKRLKQEGKILVLLSSGDVKQQKRKLDRLGLRRYFDRIVFDASIGSSNKLPHVKKIIQWLKKRGINREDMIMVGDRITSEIEAGNRLGLKTVRILKGRYSGLKPENKRQRPDHTIRDLSGLLRIV
ncbi:MAG: HAD family hydrolase [Candidatus Woesearchaeota archaeon]